MHRTCQLLPRVIHVTTSHGGNGWRSGEGRPVDATVDRREHYATGLAGFVLSLAALVVWYPLLRDAAAPLAALSSTAIVVFGVVVWASSWYGLELLWEWRGR